MGIGLVAAAVGAARWIAATRPAAIVLVGTAGALPGSGLTPGDVVVARRVGLGSPAVTLGLGYQPAAPDPILAASALTEGLDARPADVLTNLAITTEPALAARFGLDWQVEHMEAFAVAAAAAAAGIPFAAVLGITNHVGPAAHAEWRLNRSHAEECARLLARRIVAKRSGRG